MYSVFSPETGETRDEVWAAFNSTLEPVFTAGALGVVLFQVMCLSPLLLFFFIGFEGLNLHHECR